MRDLKNRYSLGSKFEWAAERLLYRYYRRFPSVHPFKWDTTSVKARWYKRNNCYIVKGRLG